MESDGEIVIIFSNFNFPEKEKNVKKLMEDIRKNTLEETSLEMAEWAREFTPTMEKLKTKLTISKLNNSKVKIEDTHYKKLFPKYHTDRHLLMKSPPGFGKTVCAKKITWDWAKGTFTTFQVVFLVIGVRQGCSVFDAIIEQYSEKGLEIKEETLRDTFEYLKEKVLVILDGVFDPAKALVNVSDPQTKFGHKTLVTFTIGPESKIGIEIGYKTVCDIEDLKPGEDKKLMFSFCEGDEENIDKILNSKVSMQSQFGRSWLSNPMLVMFLCFLNDKNQLHPKGKGSEVRNQSLSLCEMYLKLVMFLCGQTISALSYSVKSLGKVVLENLKSGSATVYHERDLNSILDGRLLARHRNSLVSFPHRTFGIFVGALYFILMLDCGQTVESLLGSDTKQMVFFTDHLFFYFCLAMVGGNSSLELSGREKIDQILQSTTLSCIDFDQLDFFDIASLYPNLNLALAHKHKDEIVLKFLYKLLSNCNNTMVLFLSSGLPIKQILSAQFHRLPHLASIILSNDVLENKVMHGCTESHLTDIWQYGDDLKIIVQNQPMELLTKITQCLEENSDRKLEN